MNKQETYEYLKNSNIDYEVVEHEKVFTIDEVDELNIPGKEKIAKNLFLRDDKILTLGITKEVVFPAPVHPIPKA